MGLARALIPYEEESFQPLGSYDIDSIGLVFRIMHPWPKKRPFFKRGGGIRTLPPQPTSKSAELNSHCDSSIKPCNATQRLLSQAIELDPSFAKAYGRLAKAYFQAGDFQRSLEKYHEALTLEINPDLKKEMDQVETARVCYNKSKAFLEQRVCSWNPFLKTCAEMLHHLIN